MEEKIEEAVPPVDRSNIDLELMRLLDRFVFQENELRRLRGEPQIPMRPETE